MVCGLDFHNFEPEIIYILLILFDCGQTHCLGHLLQKHIS